MSALVDTKCNHQTGCLTGLQSQRGLSYALFTYLHSTATSTAQTKL